MEDLEMFMRTEPKRNLTKQEQELLDLVKEISVNYIKKDTQEAERIVRHILSIARGYEDHHVLLERAIRTYLEAYFVNDRDEQERLYAGTIAFLWTNIYDKPYYPIGAFPIPDKKWWQFWK